MIATLALVAGLVGLTALANAVIARVGAERSILLVLVGAALCGVPGLPRVAIEPDLVLLLLLPPLLYEAGVSMSWRGFRANLRPILLLAIGCTVFTATAVAAFAHLALGLPWALGFLLGAVISPPDPVAPMAVARRLRLPGRLLIILEAEGLVNDAIALIMTRFAIAAVATGSFSLARATGGFFAMLGGETLWGVVVGWALLRLRAWINEPPVEIVLSLLTPFVAFWVPHQLGGSGVLATVGAGLYVSWHGRRLIAPATRLQSYFVWGLIAHLIEGVLFLLIGLQARTIVESAVEGGWTRFLLAAAGACLTIVAVRFVWVFPATWLPRRLSRRLRERDPLPAWRATFFVGFTGIRGVVSLVAALSIPAVVNGQPFPGRDLILFVTFCVILVTLVGQGGTLPWLIRRLGLADDGAREATAAKERELSARAEGVQATLGELARLAVAGAPAPTVAVLTRRNRDRLAVLLGTHDETVGDLAADEARLQARLILVERRRIGELYDEGVLTDEARRRIERELDLEDARNRHALESATGAAIADPEVASEA